MNAVFTRERDVLAVQLLGTMVCVAIALAATFLSEHCGVEILGARVMFDQVRHLGLTTAIVIALACTILFCTILA